MYANGTGVQEDKAEAAKWYRLAAEQGDAKGQIMLGFLYEIGTGVLKDPVRAHMWFNIAGANGDDAAAAYRDRIEAEMTPEQIADATRRARACMESGYAACD